jgi:thiosulfate dehydrogenase
VKLLRACSTGALALVSLLAACAGSEETPGVEITEVTPADRGAKLFRDPTIANYAFNHFSCATCHEAEPGSTASLILPGAPLAGVTRRTSFWGGQEIDLLGAVNTCLFYFMFKDEPWTADDEDAQLVYAYLDSLPAAGPASVPFTIRQTSEMPPPGDAERGSSLYDEACVRCHGTSHAGVGRLDEDLVPVLPEEPLEDHPLGEYTAEERILVFVEKIRHGAFLGAGGPMPPFSMETLSDQDVGDILTFLGVTP